MTANKIKTKAGYVAIIGYPNVGKSTLLNVILNTKLSIVSAKPQTTRKNVIGIYTTNSEQIIFIDTPGILEPKYELQKIMVGYIQEALEPADIITVMFDTETLKKNLEVLNPTILEILQKLNVPKIALINKIDTLKNIKDTLPLIKILDNLKLFNDIIPISAIRNTSIDTYINKLIEYLPYSEFFYDKDLLSTANERFFVAELIREQIFNYFQQEIPYSTDVKIKEFKEREYGKWYISAEIIVERESQKKIIIGEKGNTIKKIGEKSRKAIEEHLQTEIYLELFVKVRKNWRKNKSMLKFLGY